MAKAEIKKRDVSVIERRLKSGRIFGTGSQPIPLVEPDLWELRIVNASISDAHVWEMQASKGWIYAAEGDLAVQPHEVGFRVQDGRLVRGTHGQEVLMKMRRADYAEIQKAKDQENHDSTFGPEANKAAIVGAAGRVDGRAAEYLHTNLNTLEIKDARERRSLED